MAGGRGKRDPDVRSTPLNGGRRHSSCRKRARHLLEKKALTGEEQTASPNALLWSAERPFVGASAVHIPGATLRHRTGLVPAVLPASAEQGKRTLGVPQELGNELRPLRGPAIRKERASVRLC